MDHLIVSVDWSSIELVIIGELSKDPEFFKAYGQRPHGDLHTGAAASVLGIDMPWITEEMIKGLKRHQAWADFFDAYSIDPNDAKRLVTNVKGEPITTPPAANKVWRTVAGKETNFNYWYSGFLTTTGQKMGWSLSKTSGATDLYRNRFKKAEEWRVGMIDFVRAHGFVELPDGHRRFRYEATYQWMDEFKGKWPNDPELKDIVHEIARRIHRRAHNQAINALVQGTCATIMKRTILRMRALLAANGMDARFMIPIHDELVFSAHWSIVPEFIRLLRETMLEHKDIFPTLALDASPAVGVTFEPWDAVKAPLGQIELFEPPAELGLGTDRLDDDGIRQVVDYLRHGRMKLAA